MQSEARGETAPPGSLAPSWQHRLADTLQSPAMRNLRAFLEQRRREGATIYPRPRNFFAALNATGFEDVRVVILGQDPYHGPGQAHGLSFSVQPGVPIPPSLQNIYKELTADIGFRPVRHGCLTHWAEQGVLLLNATLSVEAGQAGSHQGKGWEAFTGRVVECLNAEREHLVFMLWGSPAQRKGAAVDRDRHLVLQAPHPSPLSAHRGFFGCRHFSHANRYLAAHGIAPIDWQLPETA
jgi:uracil-DNA glycosylase